VSENKRYYFLQMPEDFFSSKRIKRLRNLAGGDTYTIIYLKMQLKAMNNQGVLVYDGIMESVAEEIAIDIDEKADDVQMTMNYLQSCGLLEIRDTGDCYLPYAEVNVGSITASSIRSRESRANKSVAMQQNSNTLATNCNGDIDIDIEIKKIVSKDTICQTQSVQQVVNEWNTLDKFGIKPISKLASTSTRYKQLVARIKQYGLDDVLKAIDNIRHSDYLQGRVNNWQITFDWFVKPNNFPKVLEGNYNNKSKGAAPNRPKLSPEELRKVALGE